MLSSRQKKIIVATAVVTFITVVLLILYYYFVTNVKKEDLKMYKAKYFTKEEFERSPTAIECRINNKIPTEEIENNVSALMMVVLDPLRELYGKPITITSGYRCEVLNAKIGGKNSSQHLKGEAADITGGSKEENKKIFKLIKQLGNFDQLINENNYQWIHVSFKRVGYNRKQILSL